MHLNAIKPLWLYNYILSKCGIDVNLTPENSLFIINYEKIVRSDDAKFRVQFYNICRIGFFCLFKEMKVRITKYAK